MTVEATMKSPFPGMDPYLEERWGDVHTKLCTYSADVLNTRLPKGLIARTQERVGVELDEGETATTEPDTIVLHGYSHQGRENGGVAQMLPSFKLVAISEPITERFVEIRSGRGQKLVTVIEFISPSNKGTNRTKFIAKRKLLLAGGVNVVEIDLTRGGEWHKLIAAEQIPRDAVSAYRYTIRLPQEAGVTYLQPIALREPLPVISMPLREDEPHVDLPLQSLIDEAYTKGLYGEEIDYDEPLDPPLNEADAVWAKSLIAAAKRSAS